MLETSRLSTGKLKNISKQEVPYLPSHFGLHLKKDLKFSKNFFSFIDLGLHFDMCENESYRTFVAKAGFFYAQKSV